MGASFGGRFRLAALPIIVGLLMLGRLARVPWHALWRSLLPIFPVLLITCVINAILTPGRPIRLFSLEINAVTVEGALRGLQLSGRLCAVVLTAALLTFATSPLELSDAIEAMFRPLRYVRLPVGEFALALTIALRFVPTLFDETDRLYKAQVARGADFSGGPIRRIRRLLPLLLPLVVSAFSRADRLAVALESRGYSSNLQRTRFRPLVMQRRDLVAISGALLILLCAL